LVVAILLVGPLLAGPGTRLAAQRKPSRVFAVDPEILGGSLSIASLRDDGTYQGLAFGVGGSLLTRMLLAGRHFSHPDGPSYEARDGSTDQQLVELLHVALFRRWVPTPGRSFDVGVRGSLFLHSNSFDDDPALPLFGGAYANALFGWEHVQLGPRVLVGVFTEGGGTTEFGILLVPFTGRIRFGW
jgi:hypothetical protein